MENEFQKVYKALGSPQQGVIALLLGLTQSAVNMFLKGRRDIPTYIRQEIKFFQGMSRQKQRDALRRAVEAYKRQKKEEGIQDEDK